MRFIALIISLLGAGISVGQSVQQWESHGDKSFEERDYYGAAIYYKMAIDVDDSNMDMWLKYALSLEGYHDYKKAEEAFQYIWDNYDDPRFEISQYHLAEMQKSNGKYRQAYLNFKDFDAGYYNRVAYEVQKSGQETGACRWAMSAKSDSSLFQVKQMGDFVNTTHSEFSPFMVDDTTLYFTSFRYQSEENKSKVQKEDEDSKVGLWKAIMTDSTQAEAEAINPEYLPTEQNLANGCYSPDGNRFVFSVCDESYSCYLWMAKKDEAGNWLAAEKMNEMINPEGYNTTQPSIHIIQGREILLLSSNRPRGRGKMDIWWSVFDKFRQEYGRPRNLGRNINTKGNEITPYWLADSSHFYFSSDWHYGFGGYDIFYAKGVLKSLMAPVNLGIPVNSPANDMYYKEYPSTGLSLFTSNRLGSKAAKGRTCCNDIYYAERLEPKIVEEEIVYVDSVPEEVLEEELVIVQDLLPLSLFFHNDQPNPNSWSDTTSLTYRQAYGTYYHMVEEYVKANRDIATRGTRDSLETETRAFFDGKVKYGIDRLDEAMDLIMRQVSNGQVIELTIKGFASPLAASDYNKNLTQRRITSLVNYIKAYKGGEFLPYLDPNKNGGKLTIIEEPYGESQSASHVSDDHTDKRRSIFGLSAAQERRIEIIHVEKK